MNALFDQTEADREIIESLIKTNRTLWRELESTRSMLKSVQVANKRSYLMSKVLQDLNGALYVAHKYEKLGEEEAKNLIAMLKTDIGQLEAFIAQKVDPTVDSQLAADVAPVEQAAAPAQPEAPVEQPAPAEQAAPVEAAPAVDPNAQPAAPADPNQVAPAASEQPAAPAIDLGQAPAEQPAAPVDPSVQQPLQ